MSPDRLRLAWFTITNAKVAVPLGTCSPISKQLVLREPWSCQLFNPPTPQLFNSSILSIHWSYVLLQILSAYSSWPPTSASTSIAPDEPAKTLDRLKDEDVSKACSCSAKPQVCSVAPLLSAFSLTAGAVGMRRERTCTHLQQMCRDKSWLPHSRQRPRQSTGLHRPRSCHRASSVQAST